VKLERFELPKPHSRAGCPAARMGAAAMWAPRSRRQASAGLSPHRAPAFMVFPTVELAIIKHKGAQELKAAVRMS